MKQSRQELDRQIASIYRNPENWIWERDKENPSLPDGGGIKHATDFGGEVNLGTLQDYCWAAYDKAYEAKGLQYIGRSWDISEQLRMNFSLDATIQGRSVTNNNTLLTQGTQGNILQLDKWTNVINDCWVMGGINRVAQFELLSERNINNLWNPNINGFVVTARELTGLFAFGYRLVRQSGKNESYCCYNGPKARDANLEDYHYAIAMRESRGPIGLVDIMNHSV